MSDQAEKVGGCLCGAVRYEVTGELRDVAYCHCKQCQRQSGLYFAATATEKSACDISDSEGTLTWFRASEPAERGFCSKCGSTLFWRHDEETHISILAGTLDDTSAVKSGKNIYVEDKGAFYDLPKIG